jgi:hypothetical protein
MFADAIVIADAPPRPAPLVHEVITRDTLTPASSLQD